MKIYKKEKQEDERKILETRKMNGRGKIIYSSLQQRKLLTVWGKRQFRLLRYTYNAQAQFFTTGIKLVKGHYTGTRLFKHVLTLCRQRF